MCHVGETQEGTIFILIRASAAVVCGRRAILIRKVNLFILFFLNVRQRKNLRQVHSAWEPVDDQSKRQLVDGVELGALSWRIVCSRPGAWRTLLDPPRSNMLRPFVTLGSRCGCCIWHNFLESYTLSVCQGCTFH
jgi:hypothetical protein